SIRAVTVHNNGEALLTITSTMVTGAPVWQLVDGGPVDIPGGASHDFMVKFSPTDLGPATPGQLVLMSNDNLNQGKMVELTGTGVQRNVVFGSEPPDTAIDLGFTGVGIPVTVADVIQVINNDPSVAF